jgi:hypothetical protein
MGQKLRPWLRVDVSGQDPAARGSALNNRPVQLRGHPGERWMLNVVCPRGALPEPFEQSAQCHTGAVMTDRRYSLRNMVAVGVCTWQGHCGATGQVSTTGVVINDPGPREVRAVCCALPDAEMECRAMTERQPGPQRLADTS